MTKTLSLELGEHGIRANAILPGAVEEPRIRSVFEGRARATGKSAEEVVGEALENQSINRLVYPREIDALAVFLASDQALSISGQTFPIDCDSKAAQQLFNVARRRLLTRTPTPRRGPGRASRAPPKGWPARAPVPG